MLPQVLRPKYEALVQETDEAVACIVKAADKLSAYIKCVEELKAGNLEFEAAARQTRSALETMELPEVQYFITEFLPPFSKNLDELQ